LKEEDEISTKINFGSQSFKKYFRNTSWLFTEKILKLIIGFLINIYIIRYLGPSQFGLLSYAISFVGLFAAFATLGLDNITVRELVISPDKKDEILGSTFFLKIFGAILSILLIWLTTILISETSYNKLLILIIAFSTIFQSFNVIDLYFQSKVLSRFTVYVQVSTLFISSTLKFLLVIFNFPLLYFAIVMLVETALIAAGFNVVFKINHQLILKWQFVNSRAKQLLKDSWPLILSGLVIAIYVKIDQVIIKNMMTDKDVGYYAAAVRIAEAWYFIPTAISTSVFPAIINAKKISEKLYLSRLQKLYDILAWVAICISIPITIFSKDIIKFLLGPDFIQSASVLTIYIWAGVAVFLGVASSQYLINENLTKISFLRTFIGMVFNVVLNLILIPKMGIIGSALATLISYSVATFTIGLTKKTFHQSVMMVKSILFLNLFKLILNAWQSNSKKK
jgi:O-antigen/teichoic acid export membrane protein